MNRKSAGRLRRLIRSVMQQDVAFQSEGRKMMVKRIFLSLLLLVAMAGCVSDPQMKDTIALAPGQGVMVARLYIPYLGQSGHLKTTVSVSSFFDNADTGTLIQLHDAETFIVVPLAAGTYQWKDFRMGSYSIHWSSGPMHFDIAAGKINYVGDLTLVMSLDAAPSTRVPSHAPRYDVNVHIDNYSRIFLPRVAAAYPQLFDRFPVVVNMTTTPRVHTVRRLQGR